MKLSAKKPSDTRKDVERAQKLVSEEQPAFKRLPANVPTDHIKKLKLMKELANEDTHLYLFVIEALDDLFEKYQDGNGKYKIPKRNLEKSLMNNIKSIYPELRR